DPALERRARERGDARGLDLVQVAGLVLDLALREREREGLVDAEENLACVAGAGRQRQHEGREEREHHQKAYPISTLNPSGEPSKSWNSALKTSAGIGW